MQIECTIQRKAGTKVTLGETEYHFKPEVTGGRHVAEVKNKRHIARFLSIIESFCVPGAADEEEAAEIVNPVDDGALTPSTDENGSGEAGGEPDLTDEEDDALAEAEKAEVAADEEAEAEHEAEKAKQPPPVVKKAAKKSTPRQGRTARQA